MIAHLFSVFCERTNSMARLAPIALLAFAVTLACGGPAAPTATPPAPAATPTSLAPLASPTRLTPIPSPGAAIQPSLPAPRDAIDEKLLAWSTAWATVQRFSVEIETKDAAGMVYNRSIMRVVRPDRYHLTNLDLETRQPRTQTIVIGSKTWVKLAGSDRWESFDGQGAYDFGQAWNPDSLLKERAAGATHSFEQLAPETIDGVPCERWQIVSELPGAVTLTYSVWIAESDRLPRQIAYVQPDGLTQLQRYSYNQDFDIQPPQ
jgi:hypothetical protein